MSFKDTPAGMITALTLTALLIGLGLAGFFIFAEPKIEKNRIAAEKKAIFSVIEGATEYEVKEKEVTVTVVDKKGKSSNVKKTVKYFVGLDDAKNVVGYAIPTEAPGYSAAVKIMLGVNVDNKTILDYNVTDHLETPGLGTKIEEDPFKPQFKGLPFTPKVTYIKNRKSDVPSEITAIAGATISSVAIVNAVNNGTRDLLAALGR